MSTNDTKSETSSGMDLDRLEKTLQASIKLMKRGRREMERMRRKSRHEHPEQGQSAA